MKQTFTIPGRFIGLNEFYRMDKFEQAKVKKASDERVFAYAKEAGIKPYAGKIRYHVVWVEQNHKRDLDNIAFAKKFIQDGLVKAGILHNDTHHEIEGFSDTFAYDAQNPRIAVTLEDV